MERLTGIEPAYQAWEASALPLSYSRSGMVQDPGPLLRNNETYLTPAGGLPRTATPSPRRPPRRSLVGVDVLIGRSRKGAVLPQSRLRVAPRVADARVDQHSKRIEPGCPSGRPRPIHQYGAAVPGEQDVVGSKVDVDQVVALQCVGAPGGQRFQRSDVRRRPGVEARERGGAQPLPAVEDAAHL